MSVWMATLARSARRRLLRNRDDDTPGRPRSGAAWIMKEHARRRVVLGLGSNLGDREAAIAECARAARARAASADRCASSLYLTEPVGGPPQGWFVNAVAGGRDGALARGAARRLPRDRARAGPRAHGAERPAHDRRRHPALRRRSGIDAAGARDPAPAAARAALRARAARRDRCPSGCTRCSARARASCSRAAPTAPRCGALAGAHA